jgi:regulatory protein
MATITDIAPQKRRDTRVSVYLDDEFWTGMPTDLCAVMNLKVGQEVSQDLKESVEQEVGETAALEAGLHLLGYRDRSEREMRQRLAQKDFGPEVIEAAVVRMKEYGYLDDDDFARQVIEGQQFKGKGRRAAEYALRKAGVSDEQMAAALDQDYPAENEVAIAVQWAERRADVSTPEGKQKLIRQLASRGFSYDVAQQVVAQLQEA